MYCIAVLSVKFNFHLSISPPDYASPFDESSTSVSDYVSAIIGGYWSYAGWQGVPTVIEDVEEPK